MAILLGTIRHGATRREVQRHNKTDLKIIIDPKFVMSNFSGTDDGQLSERKILTHGCEDSAITTRLLSGSFRKLFDLGEESVAILVQIEDEDYYLKLACQSTCLQFLTHLFEEVVIQLKNCHWPTTLHKY